MKHLKWKITRALDIAAEVSAVVVFLVWAVAWMTMVLGAPFIVLALFAKLMGWL